MPVHHRMCDYGRSHSFKYRVGSTHLLNMSWLGTLIILLSEPCLVDPFNKQVILKHESFLLVSNFYDPKIFLFSQVQNKIQL